MSVSEVSGADKSFSNNSERPIEQEFPLATKIGALMKRVIKCNQDLWERQSTLIGKVGKVGAVFLLALSSVVLLVFLAVVGFFAGVVDSITVVDGQTFYTAKNDRLEQLPSGFDDEGEINSEFE